MEMAELLAALRAAGYGGDLLSNDCALLSDTAARMPASLACASFAAAERMLGDPLIGLHAGARVQPRGAMVHLIMSAPTLLDSLRYLTRFSRLLIDALVVRLVTHGTTTAVLFEFDDSSLSQNRHLLDYSLLATVSVLRSAVGASFRLSCVRRRRPAMAGEADEHARLFQCPVYFTQGQDSLVFECADLNLPPRVANPLVAQEMEKLALALAGRVGVASSCRERVEAALRADLAHGRRGDRATTAARLALSEATLSRRLSEQGTTFKAVRDTVMWELVEVLLANPNLKLEALALGVGFSDAAAFSKACKRRMGYSPAEFRRRLGGV